MQEINFWFSIGSTYTYLTVKRLRTKINDLNLNENEKVITTCGSGVSACVIALSYYRIGNEDIPVYDGSWSEWASKNMKINKL